MSIEIKQFGVLDYEQTYQRMRELTDDRIQHKSSNAQPDAIWLLQHAPVYTLGLAGKPEHLLDTGDIPVIETDRGGQVTYHGPGQLVAYLMLNLNGRPYYIKKMVAFIEQAIIDYLNELGIDAARKEKAPGVYVEGKKIAALGVRVRRGFTYHGLALNVDMDLSPFNGINPCGYPGLECTQIKHYKKDVLIADVMNRLSEFLLKYLDQSEYLFSDVA